MNPQKWILLIIFILIYKDSWLVLVYCCEELSFWLRSVFLFLTKYYFWHDLNNWLVIMPFTSNLYPFVDLNFFFLWRNFVFHLCWYFSRNFHISVYFLGFFSLIICLALSFENSYVWGYVVRKGFSPQNSLSLTFGHYPNSQIFTLCPQILGYVN